MVLKKIRRYSPHNYRSFNAVLVTLILLSLLAINIIVILSPGAVDSRSPGPKLKTSLLWNEPTAQKQLVEEMLKNNHPDEAESLLGLYQSNIVETPLMASLQIKINKIKNEPAEVGKELLKWQEINNKYPGYRDAYLMLSILNYRLYKDTEARFYLGKAKSLDPNYEYTKKLEGLYLKEGL